MRTLFPALLALFSGPSLAQFTPPPADYFKDTPQATTSQIRIGIYGDAAEGTPSERAAKKIAADRAARSLERALKETGSGMAAGPLELADSNTPFGPPSFDPYISCYMSVVPFSHGNLYLGASPLAGKEKDIIILPGTLSGRLGLFAFAGGASFFHAPEQAPVLEHSNRKVLSTFFDKYELILRLPSGNPLHLVYKEKYRRPPLKRKPGELPFGYVLFEVDSRDLRRAESAIPQKLTAREDRSDALSVLRRKLAERIESMGDHYNKTLWFFRKKIVENPGRSEYFRSIKPCETISDDAISNAVKRVRPIFLERPRRP